MGIENILGLLSSIYGQGFLFTYSILFLLLFVEGPIVAFAASFAASQGYLNVWIVFFLFIVANQIPDMILFKIGGALRKENAEKLTAFFGLSKKRTLWLEKNSNKHSIKVLTVIKLINPITLPGILFSGYVKISFRTFFWMDLLLNVIFALVFVPLGYFSGIAIGTFLDYLKLTQHLLLIGLIMVVLIYIVARYVSYMMSKRIEK